MKKTAPPPKSIKLRAEAARLYEEAKQGGNESALKREAKVEKEACGLEDCEDFLWSLNQALGENTHGFQEEPSIRAELARLDQDIGRRITQTHTSTDETAPPSWATRRPRAARHSV